MKYSVIEKQKWQVKMGRYPDGSKDRSGKPFAMVRPLDPATTANLVVQGEVKVDKK